MHIRKRKQSIAQSAASVSFVQKDKMNRIIFGLWAIYFDTVKQV